MVRRCIVTLASLGVAVLVTTPVLSCTTVCVLEKDKPSSRTTTISILPRDWF